jgi:hypothetical protein
MRHRDKGQSVKTVKKIIFFWKLQETSEGNWLEDEKFLNVKRGALYTFVN